MSNVTGVVHRAIQRALRCSALPSLGRAVMKSAPTSGRKVVTDRIGQLISADPTAEHEPGDECRHSDQHGKGVVIEIPGLQSNSALRDLEHTRRTSVRAEAVHT